MEHLSSISPENKIMTLPQAVAWSRELQAKGEKIVVTNGVFDLLHRGHAQYLHDASLRGDRLLVAINSDEAVHAIKGPSRPIVSQEDRAYLVASLGFVDCVVIFDTPKPLDVFRQIHVDVYAKGGDYTEETLDRDEYPILKAMNPEFAFIPFVAGRSTTNTIRTVRNGKNSQQDSDNSSFDPRLSLLFGRRSVRAFQPRPVDDAMITMLLDAAMAAPSAGAADPWHFIVLKDNAVRKAVADALPNGKFLAEAPTGVLICANSYDARGHLLSYMLQDCAAAMQNLLLAAHAISLGACWLGIHPRLERMEAIERILGLPDGTVPVCAAAIGWPAQDLPPRTRAKADRIHLNHF